MTAQLRLPGLDPPRQIRPAAGRSDPAVWVRRLCVLKDLRPEPEHVVRSITMRRGLNILWAPPKQPKNGNALFRDAVAGHTAGKTTFCRLIRYVLGEHGFATESTRRRIRDKFPSGWVLGEVVLGEHLWTVARPFGVGAHPFAVRGNAVEAALDRNVDRVDFQAFLGEVETVTVGALPTQQFPASNEVVRWEHLLPWLTRDQECRFADVLEWRHSSSSSGAPSLTADDRHFLVRSVLGLISDEERAEQQRNAQLVARKKEWVQREPLLVYQASVDHNRVRNLLGVDLAAPSSDLFGSQGRDEIRRRRMDLERRVAELETSDQRVALQSTLERAVEAEANARRDLQDAENRFAVEQETLRQLKGDMRKNGQLALLASLPPAREYCGVPMILAQEHGCPLAISRPVDLAEKRSERSAAEEIASLERIVQALGSMIEAKRRSLAAAESSTKEARRALLAAATLYEERRGRLLEERAQLDQAEGLVNDAEDAWKRATEHGEAMKRLDADIKGSYDRQEELRRDRREALARFSATFDYVVRALLGDEVEGRADASGRSLVLTVEHHGERDSAALATVKLLAFDLAALTESVEGRGEFPRFLIHDGPHEADMDLGIYERLFVYARQLEACFKEDAGFQYIVTTTTPPPEALRREPWLLQPVLDASRAGGRILGVDL